MFSERFILQAKGMDTTTFDADREAQARQEAKTLGESVAVRLIDQETGRTLHATKSYREAA